ncbi:MAG: carbamoyltransferase HypF [Endomicrobia bacterium]|nr:carbamoyltransferase HypF [Endomicrobiia bacterium]MCL2798926.1 carbamoyltransferase HypF [Endomicrobiia bacterium]
MKSEKLKVEIRSVKIKAFGVVQGVGFRPIVFNLAKSFNLSGYVRNTGFGAEISVSGSYKNIRSFFSKLKKSSFDASYKQERIPYVKYCGFKIIESKKTKNLSEFPHDLALCNDCKKELFSSSDRRYKYPFINCVKCGPRFSIIKKLPYDRKNTTMNRFEMCAACEAEYSNPSNRRFHAQPNACCECGPRLYFYDGNKKLISEKGNAFDDCVGLLKKGKIAAIKSIGGYHLICDALNINSVKILRQRKQRPFKPFAVMAEIKTALKLCAVNGYEKKALLSDAAPIVLLRKNGNSQFQKNLEIIAPSNNSIGVMLPYAPLHHMLIKEIPMLIMTSGNRSDEPICSNEAEAFKNLKGIADCFLTHDRDIENRCDDSIIGFLPDSGKNIIVRRSRGFVPDPIDADLPDGIFAAGGDLKNNFCVTRENKAYMSHYIGDLSEKLNLDFYGESVKKMKNFLEVNPKKAVCDAHPQYFSSQYVKSKYKKTCEGRHHYAHIASAIAEHKLRGTALGFSFDGSGYGEDGKIWGGEIVFYNSNRFERLAHLDYFKLPGGDVCIKEIWRTALSLLHKYSMIEHMPESFKKFDYKPVLRMLDNNINCPQTSSIGRLFDALSALLGVKYISTFEAEGAIALESLAASKSKKFYPFEIKDGIIDVEPVIRNIISDLENKISKNDISVKFHNTVCEIIIKSVLFYARKYNISQIVLSGGVFQNMFLLKNSVKKLKSHGFKVYFNEKVPINDGGISLGQAFMTRR